MQTFFEIITEAIERTDFNGAIYDIQTALGQTTGDDAGIFFSGDEYEDLDEKWSGKTFEEKKAIILPYITHELRMNVNETEEVITTTPAQVQAVIDRIELNARRTKDTREKYQAKIADYANALNRAELINYLATTDPNGTYTDKDSRSQDMPPMTIEDAREVFTRQLVDAIF